MSDNSILSHICVLVNIFTGGEGVEKSRTEIALISKDVINLLAEKKCTVEEAYDVLRKTERCIGATADVKKLNRGIKHRERWLSVGKMDSRGSRHDAH